MRISVISLFLTISSFAMSQKTIYDYSFEKLSSSDTIHLQEFKGKKILFVNVASKCGYTSQYEGLQKLHDQYKDSLVIIGFPCNQFLGQESGTEEEIVQFCQKNYGVTFLMSKKIEVKGKNQHPIYTWLTQKSQNGLDDFKVSWNFNKFLIDEEGHLIEHFDSKVKPLSAELKSKISG